MHNKCSEKPCSVCILFQNLYMSIIFIFFSGQVEPYNVSNKSVAQFSAADNCIGYFSEGSWMGIFSMLILIVIFYLAILCVFSMQTIDQYEDPRGQTISIDKLH